MIPKETIDKIFDEARIDEVVGDYVSLKKKGANLLGRCPFHNEKTPSFTVSPAKGIYKCFGCGAAGNAVNFLMQYDQITYPEALKILAKKYHIEIIEEELSQEKQAELNEREQLFLINQFANETFQKILHENEEGIAIGGAYLKERGISAEMIERFQLGFSPEQKDYLCRQAIEKGYSETSLRNAGIALGKDGLPPIDRFHGRVMFPIHNLSGRVLGFGGRTLRSDKKVAKYLNSPETDIYHKSKVLYGLYQSKRRIIQDDNCYLVEGYTDVISLHQKGIENVVASSGTSLTEDQIKLIRRFSTNITVLFDGDAAGIKASFRGIDMLLKEDMNVKVVLFPEGEDPDTYARSHTTFELEHFLKDEAKDFIGFKCAVLLEEAGNDPFKRAELIKDVVQSISLISDNITRAVYLQEAAKLLEMEEATLIQELNKWRKKALYDQQGPRGSAAPPDFPSPVPDAAVIAPQPTVAPKRAHESPAERDLVRLLLSYGAQELTFVEKVENEEGEEEEEHTVITVAQLIISDIQEDEIVFNHPVLKEIFDVFVEKWEEGEIPTEKYFVQNGSSAVIKKVIELSSSPHELSKNWKDRHKIYIKEEVDDLKMAIAIACNRLKLEQVVNAINSIRASLASDEPLEGESEDQLILQMNHLLQVKQALSKVLGRA